MPKKAEIHCHTTASDGLPTPEEAVRIARARGLEILAVTDHNTFRGSSLALRIARLLSPKAPLIIPGNEVRTEYGDILVYCQKPEPHAPKELIELREWADMNGCVLIAAHPFHPGRHSLGKSIYKLLGLLDGIEAWNSRGLPLFNYPAMKLAEKRSLPATSGSDAHVPREIGISPSILPDDVESIEDFLEAVRKARVKPTLGIPGPLAVVEALAWAIKRRLGEASQGDRI